MRKTVFSLVIIFMVVLLVGCGPSYDEEGFQVVEDYVEAIIPATETTIHLLFVWNDDPSNRRLEDVYRSALHVIDINEKYFAADKIPSFEKDGAMDEWHIMMGRGDRDNPSEEWEITGEELADAVYHIEADSWWLANRVIELHEAEGDLGIRGDDAPVGLAEDLTRAAHASEDSILELRRILYNR